jgi:hypothetical protein
MMKRTIRQQRCLDTLYPHRACYLHFNNNKTNETRNNLPNVAIDRVRSVVDAPLNVYVSITNNVNNDNNNRVITCPDAKNKSTGGGA